MSDKSFIDFETLRELMDDPFSTLRFRHSAHVVHMLRDVEMGDEMFITMLDSSYSDLMEDAFQSANVEVEVAQESEGGPLQFSGNGKEMLAALDDAGIHFSKQEDLGDDFYILTEMRVDEDTFSLLPTRLYFAQETSTIEIIDHLQNSHTFSLEKGNVVIEDAGVYFIYDLSDMEGITVTGFLGKDFEKNIFSDISDHRMFMVYELLDKIEENVAHLEVSMTYTPESVLENLLPADVLGEPMITPDEETLSTPPLDEMEAQLRHLSIVSNDPQVLENFHDILGHQVQFVNYLAGLKWKHSQRFGSEVIADDEELPHPTHTPDKTLLH